MVGIYFQRSDKIPETEMLQYTAELSIAATCAASKSQIITQTRDNGVYFVYTQTSGAPGAWRRGRA